MWRTLPNNADLDCFKTPILHEILRIQNVRQVEHCAFSASHTFVPISCGCVRNKLQFHTDQQNPKSSLDAGLRLDGIPALDLWDLIVAVLGYTNQCHKEHGDLSMNKSEVRSPTHTIQKRKQSQGVINDLDNVDFILLIRHIFSSRSFVVCVKKTTKQCSR